MLKKTLFTFMLVCCVTTALASNTYKNITLIKTFHNGELYKKGDFNIVVVKGSFYQMGEQYGELLKKQIKTMYQNVIVDTFINSKITTLKEMEKDFGTRAWNALPARFKRLYEGASKTSGLSTQQLILLDGYASNAILHVDKMFGPNGVGACSFIATSGAYTKDHQMIVGRNFDWLGQFQRAAKFLTVTVFQPNDGSSQVATIGYAGSLATFSGLNDHHLFLELNSGVHSGGMMFMSHMASYKNEILGLLFDTDSLEGLADRVNTIKPDWVTIINIANQSRVISFENAPYRTMRRINKTGLLVATNQYRLPNWNVPVRSGPEVTYSKRRYDNLSKLAEQNKGNITAKKMRFILDQKLYDKSGNFKNGATKTYAVGAQDVTTYQIVYLPKSFNIWLKVPQHTDWVHINLNKFFDFKEHHDGNTSVNMKSKDLSVSPQSSK